eukprot:NODE_306_length_10184_cov_0.912246.p4 type:complete len:330 gc:universal NODE_306_length_10184_cov_0.912246:8811-9800(+)
MEVKEKLKAYLNLKKSISLDELLRHDGINFHIFDSVLNGLRSKNSRVIYKLLELIKNYKIKSDNNEFYTKFFDNLKEITVSILKSYNPPANYYNKARTLFMEIVENNFEANCNAKLKMCYFHLKKTYPEFNDIIAQESEKRDELKSISESKQRMHFYITQEVAKLQQDIDHVIASVETIYIEFFPSVPDKTSNKTQEIQVTGITKSLAIEIVVKNDAHHINKNQNEVLSLAREKIDFQFVPALNHSLNKLEEFKITDNALVEKINKLLTSVKEIRLQMAFFELDSVQNSGDDINLDDFEEVINLPRKRKAKESSFGTQRKRFNLDNILG